MRHREAVREDAPAIAGLRAESWRATFADVLSEEYRPAMLEDRNAVWQERLSAPPPNQLVIVAEEGGRLTGFACAYGDEDAHWGTFLDNLHVRGDWQGRGIGKSLMGRLAEWCVAEHPGSGLHLLVLEKNERARAFYDRLGAENVGGET